MLHSLMFFDFPWIFKYFSPLLRESEFGKTFCVTLQGRDSTAPAGVFNFPKCVALLAQHASLSLSSPTEEIKHGLTLDETCTCPERRARDTPPTIISFGTGLKSRGALEKVIDCL